MTVVGKIEDTFDQLIIEREKLGLKCWERSVLQGQILNDGPGE